MASGAILLLDSFSLLPTPGGQTACERPRDKRICAAYFLKNESVMAGLAKVAIIHAAERPGSETKDLSAIAFGVFIQMMGPWIAAHMRLRLLPAGSKERFVPGSNPRSLRVSCPKNP